MAALALTRLNNKIFIFAALICSITYAADDVYVYKDKDGHTIVSNVNKNGLKIALPPLNVYAVPMSKSDVFANGYVEQKPYLAKKPLMSTNEDSYFTVKQNSTRKEILQDELNKETHALADSNNLLKMSKSMRLQNENSSEYQARIKIIEDSITEHEKNIDMLQKEIN